MSPGGLCQVLPSVLGVGKGWMQDVKERLEMSPSRVHNIPDQPCHHTHLPEAGDAGGRSSRSLGLAAGAVVGQPSISAPCVPVAPVHPSLLGLTSHTQHWGFHCAEGRFLQ